MISIVCVYNDEEVFSDYLLNSLRRQTSVFELIKLNNTQHAYPSAAAALNHGGAQAKGKYIMFAHQDVDLVSDAWLYDTERILDSIPDLGIAGVAGMSEQGNSPGDRGRNIITHGDPPTTPAGKPIQEPERVQTLDECLVITPKLVFAALQFDEKVCADWHLYAVDYCLSVQLLHHGVYAIPMPIYHQGIVDLSTSGLQRLFLGALPKAYYRTLWSILKKHRRNYGRIYTTCGDWSTAYPLILQRPFSLAKRGLPSLWKRLQEKVRK